MKTEITYTFTGEELAQHDKDVAERAYKSAAKATIRKLAVLIDKPVQEAMHDIYRYVKYLIREYKLDKERK